MKNKVVIFRLFILIITAILVCIPNVSLATGGISVDTIIKDGKRFMDTNTTTPINGAELKNMATGLLDLLMTIGAIVALIITSILGIRFIVASPSAKADIKESLIPYVIGIIVIFGAFGIWKIALAIIGTL